MHFINHPLYTDVLHQSWHLSPSLPDFGNIVRYSAHSLNHALPKHIKLSFSIHDIIQDRSRSSSKLIHTRYNGLAFFEYTTIYMYLSKFFNKYQMYKFDSSYKIYFRFYKCYVTKYKFTNIIIENYCY